MKNAPIKIDNSEYFPIEKNIEVQKFVYSVLSEITDAAPIKEHEGKYYSKKLKKEELSKRHVSEIYADTFLLEVLLDDTDHAYEYRNLTSLAKKQPYDNSNQLINLLSDGLDKMPIMSYDKFAHNLHVEKSIFPKKKYYFYDFDFALSRDANKGLDFSYLTDDLNYNKLINSRFEQFNQKVLKSIGDKVTILNNINETKFEGLIEHSKLYITDFFQEYCKLSKEPFYDKWNTRIEIINRELVKNFSKQ